MNIIIGNQMMTIDNPDSIEIDFKVKSLRVKNNRPNPTPHPNEGSLFMKGGKIFMRYGLCAVNEEGETIKINRHG